MARASRPHVRALLSLTAVAFALALVPAASWAASPGGTLGVYAGSGRPDAVAQFESQLGRPLTYVHDALARESWAALTNVGWWLDQWRPTTYHGRVIYSVPMLPDSGGTLAAGAAGDYNGYFRTLAERLVAGGAGDATLRLGWEMNGTWFRWSIDVPGGAADYAAYWRRIVTTMRSVPGANFTFDWCPAADSPWVDGKQIRAETAYPGDAYVDYIGLDVYDQSWVTNHQDPAARWDYYLITGNGLRWHRDFAAAHAKPMTFPEWGLVRRSDGHGGGDAPYFIEQMYHWITTNNVAYNLYFEFVDAGDHRIFSGQTPNAAQRFRELFGTEATAIGGASGGGAGTGDTSGGTATGGSATAGTTSPSAGTVPSADMGTVGVPSAGAGSLVAPSAGTAGAGAPSAGASAPAAAPATSPRTRADANLRVRHVRISRRSKRLRLRATLSRSASGVARITLSAGGRRTRFTARVHGGRLSVSRRLARRQARRTGGVVTVSYRGNALTRAQRTRVRFRRSTLRVLGP